MIKTFKIRLVLLAVLLLSATFSLYATLREERNGILTVAFLSVGQGDAILTVCSLCIHSSSESGSQT